ncbi:ribose ABC transporter permease [Iodidimonas muriae]|uniref:Ribose ABC transporter permease n=1 Tax=Iodidimonas muriae TaxID=261467 RepID=A0ABQ2L5G5_9PROT|nr:HPF/RaiA family ribosome-associated protein [Iodidimonas muriae]GER06294.1 ribose ABC transporter permease [Kordiimonadales bacterium JCM 17843]GGO04186.1 ribose ABC transporter permease [Iodidimonas muriae]
MSSNALSVVFRGLDHSDSLEKRIRAESEKLARFFDRITGGTVTVELPHRHEGKSQKFSVHIHLTMAGLDDVTVSHESGPKSVHEDAYKAVHDAFAAAKRQLKDKVNRMQDKKTRQQADIAFSASGGV